MDLIQARVVGLCFPAQLRVWTCVDSKHPRAHTHSGGIDTWVCEVGLSTYYPQHVHSRLRSVPGAAKSIHFTVSVGSLIFSAAVSAFEDHASTQ